MVTDVVVVDTLHFGATAPTKAKGGSPRLMGIDRDVYIALCRLAQSHRDEFDALLAALSVPRGSEDDG